MEARDPTTFAGTAAVLLGVGVLAAWVPARRAARLDAAAVLREGQDGSLFGRGLVPCRMFACGAGNS
jgi:hypothetical protein